MNKIILKIDPEGEWLQQLAASTRDAAAPQRGIKAGRLPFPVSLGRGFAAAKPLEPGLSLCTIKLRPSQPLFLCYEKLPEKEVCYCRYDITNGETGSFVTHTAAHPLTQTFDKATTCHQLTLVMTRQWMTANLGLLAAPDGRMMQACDAGLTYFSYRDKGQRARKLLQRITAPSLKSVIYKGMVLELLSFTWSHLTLQKTPKAYANKIA